VRKGLSGLVWIFLFLQFSQWYNVALILSDKYLDYSFLYRVWILHLTQFTARMKYYGVWSLTEGACIMAGIAYNGIDEKTGKAKWGWYSLPTTQDVAASQPECHIPSLCLST
jgi:lysophospholipid acyltransferase